MNQHPIPDNVMRFILAAIPSVPYLEAMLLLRRENTGPWDCMRLAQRLYLSEDTARALLSMLYANGVLEITDPQLSLYRYRPESDDLRQMIDRLSDIYAKNLIGVTNLIHSQTGKKAQQFADAFLWRKDP